MYSKCSLNSYSSYLQIFGLLVLFIILIITGIYYMRVYHKNILEKYTDDTMYLNLSSKEDKTNTAEPGDRSTYPLNKYPGAELGKDNKNEYKLRDCKVYFTNNIEGCDNQQNDDNAPKTCSYTFDGWQEFDTYTDKDGKNIQYPKKIFNKEQSNTNELVNSYFTSKCFKMFNNNGLGTPKPFEYSENDLVKFDSKGVQSNTEKDTNRFGGKKYTSIQFLSSENPTDNFNNLIESICSVKYLNKYSSLATKEFYKFILNSDNSISSIQKVKLDSEQTEFKTIKENAILDFSSSGQTGLRINKIVNGGNTNYNLEVFIKSDNIVKPIKIYKFIYTTNLCAKSKIKSYTTRETTLKVSNFINFSGCVPKSETGSRTATKETGIIISARPDTDTGPFTISNNIISVFKKAELEPFTSLNVDHTQAITNLIDKKKLERIVNLTEASKSTIENIQKNIDGLKAQQAEAERKAYQYIPNDEKDRTFLGIVNFKKEGSSKRIFDYKPGYINTNIDKYYIEDDVIIDNIVTDGVFTNGIIYTFPNTGNIPQKEYNFIVPSGIKYTCDILLVGGGGAGGNAGGSGGGGDVLEFKNLQLNSGNYQIRVGDGGNGKDRPDSCSCGYPGRPGNNTSITIRNNIITAAGGGGGGSHGYEHSSDGGRGWVLSGYNPSATPTVKYIHPVDNTEMTSSGGGGGGGNRGADGGSGNTVSGNGGKTDDNNQTSGGAGGGAASPSNGGNGGNSSVTGNSYNGNGGKGIISSITGKDVEYGGGGAAGRWDNSVNRIGISSGGGGYQIWPTNYPAIPMSGGGGVSKMRGASGVVIIKIYKTEKVINLDELYKLMPPDNQQITISTELQYNIITSFVFLQKGYYRFRADIGTGSMSAGKFGHPNIKSAWLGIYDESTKDSNGKYKFLKVFKYNNENKPAYLIPYLYINTNKFYKLIYFYIAYNISGLPFNLFYKYSSTEPTLELKYSASKENPKDGFSEDITIIPPIKSTIIGVTDRYIVFTHTGLSNQTQYTFKTTDKLICDILIVAGGGAGGRNRFPSGRAGGGGGAGGLIYLQNQELLSGIYTITVGSGGNIDEGGNNRGEGFDGNNSSITGMINYTAKGGGGGGTTFQDNHYTKGRNGGSGGGAGAGAAEHWGTIPGGSGEAGQGFKGGGNRGGSYYGGAGAGGGGAGGEGNLWQNVNWIYAGAKGGIGKSINITGTSVTYAKGGDGGNWDGANIPINGESNTGNGGDGAGFKPAGNGGSGVIVIRYKTIGKISKISEKKLSIPKTVIIQDSEKINNENDMYETERIIDINDNMNSYLFSGNKEDSTNDAENNSIYQHYNSITMRERLSTINYYNNADEWKNFQGLADYLKKPAINFFGISDKDKEIEVENAKLIAERSGLNNKINSDEVILYLSTLSSDIQKINYDTLIGKPDACLKTKITDVDRFIDKIGFIIDTDKTYDKINISDTQDLLTPNLVSSIYIEAI